VGLHVNISNSTVHHTDETLYYCHSASTTTATETAEGEIADIRRLNPGAIEGVGGYTPLKEGPLALAGRPGGDTEGYWRVTRQKRLHAKRSRQRTTNTTVTAAGASSSSSTQYKQWGLTAEQISAVESGGEESEGEEQEAQERALTVLQAAELILEDVDEDVKSLRTVKLLFEQWKRDYIEQYARAYCSLSLPQLLVPLVRLELLRWEPLSGTVLPAPNSSSTSGSSDTPQADVDTVFEHFSWFRVFADFAAGIPTPAAAEYCSAGDSGSDPDDNLVPALLEATAVPQLAQCLSAAYDPLSSAQTRCAVAAASELLLFGPSAAAATQLLTAPLQPFAAAAAALCVPLVSPVVPAALELAVERLWLAVKLYSNIAQWSSLLAPAALVPVAVGAVAAQRIAPALGRLLRCAGTPPLPVLRSAAAVLSALAQATPRAWREAPEYAQCAAPLAVVAAAVAAAAAAPGGGGDIARSALKVQCAGAVAGLQRL
jgi:GC-rich sequence DNA-binding factor-like protein